MKNALKQYVNEHLDRRRFARKTKVSYANWISRFADFFGKNSISEFTLEDVSEFLRSLEEKDGLSPSTIKQAANSLHFLFNTLEKQNWEIRRLRKKSIKRLPQEVPTQKQVFSILKTIPKEQPNLAVSLIYSMGLHLNEVLTLRINDIDFKNNIIHIPSKQGKNPRKAVLAKSIKPKLDLYLRKNNPSKWLFENRKGTPLNSSTIQKAVKTASKKLGYTKNISVKSLRYAYVKHLEQLGENLQDVLNELGMSHHTSYKFYSQLGQKYKKISISPIDREINENPNNNNINPFISINRIKELEVIQPVDFDLTKLIQLLRGINISSNNKMHLSTAMQIRAVIDHVPPIFQCKIFKEVANNYNGTRSFKKSMQNLQNSFRNIADSFLHTHIRKSEVLPTANQVDFRAELDVLLSEIVRINK